MKLMPAILVSALCLLAIAPSGEAQYTYQAAGFATKDGEVYRVGMTRHPDAAGFPTLGVGIAQRNPTPENPFNIEMVEQSWFYVVDNFNTAPGATLSTHYFAFPTDPGVDFAFEGVQTGHTVTGTGHYKEYTIALTIDVGI